MDIFVSYSSRDRNLAQSLVDDLSALRHSVELENSASNQRLQWDQAFEQIARAQVFILTLTPDTLASYARRIEYNFAMRLGKPVIPVRLRPVDVTALPESINFIVDFTPQNSLANEELERVLSIVGSTSKKRAASAAPFFPSGELRDSLGQLRERINHGSQTPETRAFINLNLRDFLERAGTGAEADALTALFNVQGLLTSDAAEAQPAPTVYGDAPRRSSGRAILASALIVMVLGVLVILFARRPLPTDTTLLRPSPSQRASVMSVIDNITPVTAMPLTPFDLPTAIITSLPSTVTPSQQDVVVALASLAPSLSAALTSTVTPTLTPSLAPTLTETRTQQATNIPLSTNTVTPTETIAATQTDVPTLTDTPTTASTNTDTPAPTATSTPTVAATYTLTTTYTLTPTETPTLTPTETATATYTLTPTPTLTDTSSALNFLTPLFTATPSASINGAGMLQSAVYVGMQVEDTAQGVRIVSAGTSATSAGAQPGDVILAVDLNDVATTEDFYRLMDGYSVFSTPYLRLRRNGGIVFALVSLGVGDYVLPTATPLP